MAITLLVIAGGVALAGVAAKLANDKKLATKKHILQGVGLPTWDEFDIKLQQFVQDYIDPLLVGSRETHLQDLASDEPLTISETEKGINRYLPLSVTALGLSLVGSYLFPPALIGAVAIGLGYTFHICQDGYYQWQEEHRLKTDHLIGLYCLGVWGSGYYMAGSLGMIFYAFGEKLVIMTQHHTNKNLTHIFGKQPKFVWVWCDGAELRLPFDELKKGDIVVLHAGETIPSDGIILKGEASIDQHMLTGEYQPVEKGVNESVFASTVLLAGTIHVEVDKTGNETIVAQIGQILDKTLSHVDKLESEAMEVSHKTVGPSLLLSLLSIPMVGLSGAIALLGSNYAVNLTVLGPMSMLNFLSIASHNGILVKDGRALELLNKIDTVVFDKTGTLTEQIPTLARIYTTQGITEDEVLTLAAAAEYKQTHPLAKAILTAAQRRGLQIPTIGRAQYEVGYGIKVNLEQQVISVGSYRFMQAENLDIPATLSQEQEATHGKGQSLIFVGIDNKVVGAIELQPTLRSEAKDIINHLHEQNLATVIISGDQEGPTRKLAEQLGVSTWFANVLPEQKADLIKQLQAEGRKMCFVGDGINDALALKTADVSISLSGATTIATDTAHIVLMDGHLKQLPYLFALSKELNDNVKLNILSTVGGMVVCGVGILFFNFGVVMTEVLYSVTLATGLKIAMDPLFKHKNKLKLEEMTLEDKPKLLVSKQT